MPTYQYRCTECGHDLEVVQKFSDAALTQCPTCGGSLRKIYNAVGVVFKGSGFYRTDSRANGSESGADKKERAGSDDSSGSAPKVEAGSGASGTPGSNGTTGNAGAGKGSTGNGSTGNGSTGNGSAPSGGGSGDKAAGGTSSTRPKAASH